MSTIHHKDATEIYYKDGQGPCRPVLPWLAVNADAWDGSCCSRAERFRAIRA